MNILLIGTDTRDGKGNEGYGDTGSVGHADTTLLLHVSKDRSNATVLSIPRDMITDIPDCETKQKDGTKRSSGASRRCASTPAWARRSATPAAPGRPSRSSPGWTSTTS